MDLTSCALIGLAAVVVSLMYFKNWNPWIPITKVNTRRLDRLVKQADDVVNDSFYLATEAADCAGFAGDFARRAADQYNIGMTADSILYANLSSAVLFWVATFKQREQRGRVARYARPHQADQRRFATHQGWQLRDRPARLPESRG